MKIIAALRHYHFDRMGTGARTGPAGALARGIRRSPRHIPVACAERKGGPGHRRRDRPPSACRRTSRAYGPRPPSRSSPESYEYSFSVDGAEHSRWPRNPLIRTAFKAADGTMVRVPGRMSWDPPRCRTARSRTTSTTRRSWATIAITTSTRRRATIPRARNPYPVLYLLHGLGDDAAGWLVWAART